MTAGIRSPRRRPWARGGFSLPEALVVALVAGLALSLLLPAIARSREAAAQSRCTNNLGQLGLATAGYENVHGTLPPGAVPLPGGGTPLSWLARLLPHLDEGRLVGFADFAKPVDAGTNAAGLAGVQITTLQCPGDPFRGGSYAGVRHHRETPPASTDTGLLPVGFGVPASAVFDGLSHTLLCGEKRAGPAARWWAGGNAGSLRTGHAPPGADPAAGFAGHHVGADGGGGAFFALGDGAVRWVPAATDAGVFARLCRRADGGLPVRWDAAR